MVLALPMAALSLSVAAPRRAAAAQPARLAGGVKAVSLSARRCDALSAGAVALRRPAAAPKAAARAVPTEAKLKTRKSAAKRYKVTASGKLVRRHAMKGHLLSKKSPKRKRFLNGEALVERCDINNAKDCLPYAGVKG